MKYNGISRLDLLKVLVDHFRSYHPNFEVDKHVIRVTVSEDPGRRIGAIVNTLSVKGSARNSWAWQVRTGVVERISSTEGIVVKDPPLQVHRDLSDMREVVSATLIGLEGFGGSPITHLNTADGERLIEAIVSIEGPGWLKEEYQDIRRVGDRSNVIPDSSDCSCMSLMEAELWRRYRLNELKLNQVNGLLNPFEFRDELERFYESVCGVIYGFSGWTRYHLQGGGDVLFNSCRADEKTEKAKKLGFRIV